MDPYYILIVCSVYLFFQGFFPIATKTRKVNTEPPTHINNISLSKNQIYTTDIQKTILIVIDALRLDFVNPELMPLTSNITAQYGCSNKVTVETPTVTLPRIKALTAGNVPQFIDLVLNLASTEILEDSLIHSAFRKEKRLVFYGDDTWLKLFPNFFTRHEGTNSFFVRDFKEVDDNVTRNVYNELNKQDWDVMILHYLGLDHIGHVYGPFSPLVPEKLREMDTVIYKIYSKMALRGEKTLLLITGDHGMRDSGGHGGSTYFETHVPLLAVGLQCTNGAFPQTDVPVNLAVLLGLNIPSTSIGQLRSNLLSFSLEKYLFVLRYNTLLLLQKSTACGDHFDLASNFHEMYLQNLDKEQGLQATEHYKNCSDIISKYLIKSSVKQNSNSLITAILIMFNILIVLIKKLILQKQTSYNLRRVIQPLTFLIIILIQFTVTNDMLSLISILILVIFSVINVLSLFKKNYNISNDISLFLLIFSVIHPFTFVSSSFIEEEHQFWYYFNNIFVLINTIIFFKDKNWKSMLYWLTLLVVIRFLRTINSTGDKWANYPDFSDFLLKPENYYLYHSFFVIGLGTIYYIQHYLSNRKEMKISILTLLTFILIFIFKNSDYENILVGKIIWFLILFHAICFYSCPKVVIWILISTVLLKPYNMFLIPFCVFAHLCFSKKFDNPVILTLCHSWLGNTLYFAQGHSNSLASVDISVGYVGLSEYKPLYVLLQVLCHTYSLPVLCHFLIFRRQHIDNDKVWSILFCNRLFIMLITCINTLIHKHHLFIWSVFAPKLFIESVHAIFLFVEFCVYYCFKQICAVSLSDY